MTYRELDDSASHLAGHLKAMGVTLGAVVPVLLERSFAQIVASLAVMRAGAAYLPMDIAWPDERIRAILKDSLAEVFIAPYDVAGRLESGLRSVCPKRGAAAIASSLPAKGDEEMAGDELAYLIYTSGSTGTPKGVEITHANLMNLIAWHTEAYGVTAADRASHIAGLGFDAAVWEVWPYLANGATVQLPGRDG